MLLDIVVAIFKMQWRDNVDGGHVTTIRFFVRPLGVLFFEAFLLVNIIFEYFAGIGEA